MVLLRLFGTGPFSESIKAKIRGIFPKAGSARRFIEQKELDVYKRQALEQFLVLPQPERAGADALDQVGILL